jgi:hypothetical protein
MEDLFTSVWNGLDARVTGPLAFRLILQPAVAAFLAIRAGIGDAHAGRPPYFWSLFTDAAHWRERVRAGWQDVSKVFIVAVAIDVIYQLIVRRWVYPGEALGVAFLLACLPYLVLRGPVERIASSGRRQRA